MPTKNYDAIVMSPLFALGIHCDGNDWVENIDFLEPCAEKKARSPLAQEVARQLHAYFKDPAFAFNLPLKPSGTPFQRRVWTQIAAIPWGKTLSYGEVAATIKSGPRAVGGACGANPFPVVVPCHRVIASGGALGGFSRHGGGFLLDIKRWLLAHEQH